MSLFNLLRWHLVAMELVGFIVTFNKEHAKSVEEAWNYALRQLPEHGTFIGECERSDTKGWDGSLKKGEEEPCVVNEKLYEGYLKAVEERQNDLVRWPLPLVRFADLDDDWWVKPDFIGKKWLLRVDLSYRVS